MEDAQAAANQFPLSHRVAQPTAHEAGMGLMMLSREVDMHTLAGSNVADRTPPTAATGLEEQQLRSVYE